MKVIKQMNGEDRPELVFALVAPVGADLERVSEDLTKALAEFGYNVIPISLSTFLHERTKTWQGAVRPEREYYIEDHQKAGNALRSKMQRGDALAIAAVKLIREYRERQTGKPDEPLSKQAYLIRQLKHPHEVRLLRDIYGDAFFLLAGYIDRHTQEENLTDEIAKSHQDAALRERYRTSALPAIQRDRSEEDVYGQNVRDTYPLADVFFDSTKVGPLTTSIRRFLDLVFGYPFHTPTPEEYLMFQAYAVSLRSADLSRQVGALIANRDGSVIAVGMNDVPKVGGGQYQAGDSPDYRDYALGEDQAFRLKGDTLNEILTRLEKWILDDYKPPKLPVAKRTQLATEELKGTRLLNIGEFGRMVHAEMAAIIDAARRGVPVQDQVLFTTTFPCQNCAKHILAAGMRVVVYMEPYPKSLVDILHKNEIELCAQPSWNDIDALLRTKPGKLLLCAYLGVAPRRYPQLFLMPERKNSDGTAISWKRDKARPRISNVSPNFDYLRRERSATKELTPFLKET